jgi:nicotinamide N-methyltransferase
MCTGEEEKASWGEVSMPISNNRICLVSYFGGGKQKMADDAGRRGGGALLMSEEKGGGKKKKDDEMFVDELSLKNLFFNADDTESSSEDEIKSGDHPTNSSISISYSLPWDAHGHGDIAWNAARALAIYLGNEMYDGVEGKKIIEFGAGCGLPSLVCLSRSPKLVCCTDYPASEEQMRCLDTNLQTNKKDDGVKAAAMGFIWGESVEELLHLSQQNGEGDTADCVAEAEREKEVGFDLLLLADVIYNPTFHEPLLESCAAVMKGVCTVCVLPCPPYAPCPAPPCLLAGRQRGGRGAGGLLSARQCE